MTTSLLDDAMAHHICTTERLIDDCAAPAANLDELRSAITKNGKAWMELLDGGLDGEADIVEHGDGWNFHSPTGFRLARVIQHGTDHRSQTCTALTSFGFEPPGIDLWAFGEATGCTRPEYL